MVPADERWITSNKVRIAVMATDALGTKIDESLDHIV